MVLIYIILSMEYSPFFLNAALKIKFTATAAHNQFGYSCSTTLKIDVVLQGPYAVINYTSGVSLSCIVTSA